MNSYDGFEEGITKQEGIESAKIMEECGADAIVVSSGFVSKTPMYVMRGAMPFNVLLHFMKNPIKRFLTNLKGEKAVQPFEFKEGYLIEDAKEIKKAINIPIILVGGLNSMETINKAFDEGFEFMSFARSLIKNPNFINDLRHEVVSKSNCTICNYCFAKTFSGKADCIYNDSQSPKFATA
jgi:2,4-dienoyl-CoA reductase-like NADH-dependent reductase (Old Yellow Enzyme family)